MLGPWSKVIGLYLPAFTQGELSLWLRFKFPYGRLHSIAAARSDGQERCAEQMTGAAASTRPYQACTRQAVDEENSSSKSEIMQAVAVLQKFYG